LSKFFKNKNFHGIDPSTLLLVLFETYSEISKYVSNKSQAKPSVGQNATKNFSYNFDHWKSINFQNFIGPEKVKKNSPKGFGEFTETGFDNPYEPI